MTSSPTYAATFPAVTRLWVGTTKWSTSSHRSWKPATQDSYSAARATKTPGGTFRRRCLHGRRWPRIWRPPAAAPTLPLRASAGCAAFSTVERWRRELAFGLRVLRKDRGFTATAIVTLAVCLGGHAAIVAAVNAMLLHPLRVPEPDRVLLMANQYPLVEARRGTRSSTPDYGDRLRHVTVFEEQALYNFSGATVEAGGVPTRMRGMVATPSLFRLLRVSPAQGRIFTDDEGEPGNDTRVILTDGLWRELFGADPAVIGRTLRMSGREFTIVGILPRGFSFGDPDARFWIPLALTARQRSDDARHRNGWFSIGRLKPAATIEQVRDQLKALDAVNLERMPPRLRSICRHDGVLHWRRTAPGRARPRRARSTLSPLGRRVRRAGDRRRESRHDRAGAFPRPSQRDGDTAGPRCEPIRYRPSAARRRAAHRRPPAPPARWPWPRGCCPRSVWRCQGPHNSASMRAAAGITFALGMLAGVLVGLVSASPLYTIKLGTMLHEGLRGGTRGRAVRTTWRTLVVAQMTCSFILLMGSALLWVSVRNLLAVDPGFRTDNVISGVMSLSGPRYAADDGGARVHEPIARGDPAAAWSRRRGRHHDRSDDPQRAERGRHRRRIHSQRPGEPVVSGVRSVVTPGYFETVGTPLVRGRYFDARDEVAASRSIVVDERLARRFWPDGDAIGQRMFCPMDSTQLAKIDANTPWLTVIGVVRTARLNGPAVEESPSGTSGTYYVPYAAAAPRDVGYVIRTEREWTGIVRDVRSALAQHRSRDPALRHPDALRAHGAGALVADEHDAPGDALCGRRRVPVGARTLRHARLPRHPAHARDRCPPGRGKCTERDRRADPS